MRTAQGGRFFSRANLELQRLTRDVLEAILEDCYCDCHLSAMRYSRPYRRFYQPIREADDTKIIGQAMKEACAARESGELSLQYFTLLKTASRLQRERLEQAPLSKEARVLIREVEAADNLLDSFVEKLRSLLIIPRPDAHDRNLPAIYGASLMDNPLNHRYG